MIERKEYLEELKRWKDKDLIKVITGIRRCGKSTLFELFINYLLENDIKEEQIIHINLEDADYDFATYKELYDYINNKLDSKKQYYIFLDEVQVIDKFEKAVDSLYIKKNVDVYITGSNAYLLSGELATLLSGRYIEIKMLPLSFKEYVTAFDDKDYQKLFLNYMKNGGMPGNISIATIKANDQVIWQCAYNFHTFILPYFPHIWSIRCWCQIQFGLFLDNPIFFRMCCLHIYP